MLSELMERGAQLMSANPHLNKSEAARRIGCTRRTITNWLGNEEFTARLEELQGAVCTDIPTLVAGMSDKERGSLIARLRKDICNRVVEIEMIEKLVHTEEGAPNIELLQRTTQLLRELTRNGDAPEPKWKEETERLGRLLDNRSPGWREYRKVDFPSAHLRSHWITTDGELDTELGDEKHQSFERPYVWESEKNTGYQQ